MKKLCKKILGRFFRASLTRLARGQNASLWVICYHHVAERSTAHNGAWPPGVGKESFRRHLEVFDANFQIAPLHRALQALENGRLSGPTLSLTFDDGPASFASLAYPLLREHRMPATVFVCGSASGEGEPLWNDALTMLWNAGCADDICRLLERRRAALRSAGEAKCRAQEIYSDRLRGDILALYAQSDVGPAAALYMDTERLKSLGGGLVELGSHTWSHAPLSALDESSLRREIERNENYLKQFPGAVPVLSVPYGSPSRFHAWQVEFLREEMGLYVCSSHGGINFGPREADYLRIGGEVPGEQMAGQLMVEVLRSM